MMRICSATDLGLLPPVRRLSSSITRASSLLMVSFRPDTASSVMGAIVIERGEASLKGLGGVWGGGDCRGWKGKGLKTEKWRNGEPEEKET